MPILRRNGLRCRVQCRARAPKTPGHRTAGYRRPPAPLPAEPLLLPVPAAGPEGAGAGPQSRRPRRARPVGGAFLRHRDRGRGQISHVVLPGPFRRPDFGTGIGARRLRRERGWHSLGQAFAEAGLHQGKSGKQRHPIIARPTGHGGHRHQGPGGDRSRATLQDGLQSHRGAGSLGRTEAEWAGPVHPPNRHQPRRIDLVCHARPAARRLRRALLLLQTQRALPGSRAGEAVRGGWRAARAPGLRLGVHRLRTLAGGPGRELRITGAPDPGPKGSRRGV